METRAENSFVVHRPNDALLELFNNFRYQTTSAKKAKCGTFLPRLIRLAECPQPTGLLNKSID
jgi:hypothetical protein